MKPPDSKATGGATTRRHLRSPLPHLRSNIVAYVALAVAVGSGGSYALAATTSNGTIAVCVDKGSGVMHLAKHPRCGRRQSRVGLSSALDRPTVSAWAAAEVNGAMASGSGAFVRTRVPACMTSRSPPPAAACARTTRRWSASTTASRRMARAASPFSGGVDGDRRFRDRGLHDPHRRGGKRSVPAQGRVVQLH